MNPLIATQPVYQADMDVLQSIHHCREKIQFICRQHMHRCVHVQTTSGQVYEGTVVGVDEHHLYLDLSQTQSGMRRENKVAIIIANNRMKKRIGCMDTPLFAHSE